MFNNIETTNDIQSFLEKTNLLHDGYILSIQYTNNGIEKTKDGYCFCPCMQKLTIRILITSFYDTVVEIEFDNIHEWQISNVDCIFAAYVTFNEQNLIVWSDDYFTDSDQLKKGTYVIAESMKWRVVE